jgi:hypothetical protein
MTKQVKIETIKFLIEEARSKFQQIAQWRNSGANVGYTESQLRYTHHADALIQAAEYLDCGSVGGFGFEEPHNLSLYGRWEWLRNKYYTDLSLVVHGYKLFKHFVEVRGE